MCASKIASAASRWCNRQSSQSCRNSTKKTPSRAQFVARDFILYSVTGAHSAQFCVSLHRMLTAVEYAYLKTREMRLEPLALPVCDGEVFSRCVAKRIL